MRCSLYCSHFCCRTRWNDLFGTRATLTRCGCDMSRKRFLVCITGASGAVYGLRTVRALREQGHSVHLVVTRWGAKTLEYETGVTASELAREVERVYDEDDLSAPPASGSFRPDGVVVVPCSMKTLSAVAAGLADNLVVRAADCTLKERRPLILVVREMPYNLVHLRNMVSAAEAGAMVLPASPAFWHRPRTIDDLVDSVVDRILALLNAGSLLNATWGEGGYTLGQE